MNSSGEAADQIVRMTLSGVEVAAKITGAGAKNLAVLLYAILKDQKRTKGKTRLAAMIKSGKELKVFALKNEDLKKFSEEAKRYGVLYCALRDRKGSADGLCDVMVRAEDAHKINRIVERFKLATVDTATIKSEIEQSKDSKNTEKSVPGKAVPDKSAEDKLLDELMEKPQQKEAQQPENPTAAKTTKSRQSEPISESKSKSEKGTTDAPKRSVREELGEIKAARKQETDTPKRDDKQLTDNKKPQKNNQHQQPAKKSRSKKSKERG